MTIFLLFALASAWVYSLLAIIAALRYCAMPIPALAVPPPVSILKPLAGLEPSLESNLRTFFEQDYPAFELLFAVEDEEIPQFRSLKSCDANTHMFRLVCL